MVEERTYLVNLLKESGIKSEVHQSMKKLKTCTLSHVGAVLNESETFTPSCQKTKYVDQSGRKVNRVKVFDKETKLSVVIGDSQDEKVEEILTEFMKNVKRGINIDGNYTSIEIGEAEWFAEEDSILKSKVSVQFPVTFHGGVYVDHETIKVTVNNVEVRENG